ncbi:MAG: ABC transporter ATP-binding protein/permease [Lachnospiraceae bacterium]|nr:ABC transporter ATP-binding protein/permease [Lachnospiraceae bacterium]
MSKIFKNLVPYWKSVLIIIVFLIIQAWCDLALPQYTSDIIDKGIQNKGIEYALPEAITKEEYELAELFMTSDEKELWQKSYKFDGDIYRINIEDEEEMENADEKLSMALIMNYSMSSVDEENFKKQMALQMGQQEDSFKDKTVDEIGQMMGMPLTTYEKEDTLYVDMRSVFKAMADSGSMQQEAILEMRNGMEAEFNKAGDMITDSMGVAYAAKNDEAAGIDVDKIQKDYLWVSGFKMIGVALIAGAATIIVGFFASKVGAGIGMNLRGKIFKQVVGFSNAEMDKFSTASLITRSTNDIQQIQMVTTLLLRMVLYAPIVGIGGIVKVVNTKTGMGWIIVVAVAAIMTYVGILVILAMPKFKIMQVMVDKVNLVSREILTGLSVIRAFGREKKEEERFDDANKDLTKTMLFTNRVMTFMMPGMMFIMYGISILIVWVGAHRIDSGHLQIGAMTAFITYAILIVMSFLMLTMMSIMLPRAGVAAERIDEVINTPSSIIDTKTPEKVTEERGVIRFEHVNFKYPGANENVLDDIDFTALPGKTTAIIGSTGCGKSTLVNLIPRLYDVTDGKITIDGTDIRNVTMKYLRDRIGYVPQKGILFSGTIATNLRFGNKDADDSEIAEAAEIAQAADFIEEKHDKYDSYISQGGTNVSGGQKQRLSIARAIAKKPDIFIFDDSFSALDMKTDAKLRKALESKVKDKTVIIVAQRISTIINADEILVLDEGKIVGKGTHKELLESCEEYLQIAKSQLSEKELGIEGKEES